ncbi:MAG: response regulator transcription factor [Deltaproteobacteria bacterium]|nr:MAG: response regulator transcription factor [Deltaproteobacteria bacterium]
MYENNKMMRVLIVEDEPKVLSFISQALESSGMTVDKVSAVSEVKLITKTLSFDVIVLDRLLHGEDSLEALSEIRRNNPLAKILVLSALSEVDEKVRGLTEGADDYLGKPFHVAELVARIRVLAKRSDSPAKTSQLSYADLLMDLNSQKVMRGNCKIDLTAKEFRLLSLLLRNPGRVYSRSDLLDQVWDLNHFPESNVVEVTVASLRSKVDKGFTPLIQSRRGAGYWLGEP